MPLLADAPDFRALGRGRSRERARRWRCSARSSTCRPGRRRLRLPRAPGRNLAVLGTRVDEACAVLDAAGRSLARQHRPGAARFSVACLDPDADTAARSLFDALGDDAAWYDEESVGELMAETAGELAEAAATPHYLLLYAVDAAAGGWPGGERTGLQQLRRILHDGPERRIHVLGWWRGVARMRADLGGAGVAYRPDRRLGGAGRAGRRAGSSLYPGPAARTGIPARGGRSSSTGRSTAPAR